MDTAVYRPSTRVWNVQPSGGGGVHGRMRGALAGDLPVPGEFDGDGNADLTVYRPSTGEWFVLHSSTGFASASVYTLGGNLDTPVPADYDGDGVMDLAIYRATTGAWSIVTSSSGFTTLVHLDAGPAARHPRARRLRRRRPGGRRGLSARHADLVDHRVVDGDDDHAELGAQGRRAGARRLRR